MKNPLELSIQDLKDKFQTVTLPVTLVCAGSKLSLVTASRRTGAKTFTHLSLLDRRKEQNVVRKGLGFNWGAAGVSTALFTGIYLSDLLLLAQPQPSVSSNGERRRPSHVVFEGADDLPQGYYGTSQVLSWAKNKDKGMLLAWAMNGEPLTP